MLYNVINNIRILKSASRYIKYRPTVNKVYHIESISKYN